MSNSQPKVNVEIPPELHHKLDEHLPHGTRKPVVNRLLWDLVSLLEGEDSELVLGAILSGDLAYEDFSSAKVGKYAQDKQPSDKHNGNDRGRETEKDHREEEQAS